MKITFPDGTVYSDKPPQGLWDEFTVPDDGYDYRFLRHDWQAAKYKYKPRSIFMGFNDTSPNISLPETVQFLTYESVQFISMTEEKQYYHLDLLRLANPSVDDATLRYQMQELYRQSVAFTDRHAHDTGEYYSPPDPTKNFRFYPTNLNSTNPKNCAWKCAISAGGNLVRLKKGTVNEIECVDPALPLPPVEEVFKKPWLTHWASVENGVRETNEQTGVVTDKLNWSMIIDGIWRRAWRVSPFPQIRNINGVKTGTPYIQYGYQGHTRIDPAMLLYAEPGSKFSIYCTNKL